MDRRRRKDEPFNPFAPNASQKAKERKEKSHRQPPRPRAPEVKKPQNDLAAKQKAAMEALRNRREIENQSKPQPVKQEVSKPKHQPSPQPKPAPKSEIKKPSKREDRLADLRAKSAATAQFAKEAQDAKKATEVEPVQIKPEVVAEPVVEVTIKDAEPIIEAPSPESRFKGPLPMYSRLSKQKSRKATGSRNVDVRLTRGAVEDSLNPRNWIEENIWNTNMLPENSWRTILLAKSIAQTYLARYGPKASVLESTTLLNSSTRRKLN